MTSFLKDPYTMVSCKLVDVINTYDEAKLEQPILREKPKPSSQV